MTLPLDDTLVSYPANETRSSATVIHLEQGADGETIVVLDRTSIHPVDAGWPDQGSDRATIRTSDGSEIDVIEAVVAATDGVALHVGRDIPAPKGAEGWAFVVAHRVADASSIAVGARVETRADADYRRNLSVGHTACHLASLALNRAVASRWRKETRADAIGSPDFDGTAIDLSLIRENGSTDTYRLGKSLRKKGFSTESLADDLTAIESAINDQLASWLETSAAVTVERDGERLTDRRYWVCALPESTARIACGGTHASSLAELGAVTVSLTLDEVDGTPILTMTTTALG